MIERFQGHWDENLLRSCAGNGKFHVLEKPLYKHTTGKNRVNPVHSVIAPYPFGFDPTFHRYRLDDYKNKSGRNIFVCSMADLFGEWVPDEWIKEVFKACEDAPQHNYLFLTKNPERYTQIGLPDCDNFWYGTTLTGSGTETLRKAGKNCFLSIEPILAPFEAVDMWSKFGWVIIGAETGKRKDKVIPKKEWIENIVTKCHKAGVPVFMKDSLKEIMENDFIQEWPESLRESEKE
jgi:hypothetical protein